MKEKFRKFYSSNTYLNEYHININFTVSHKFVFLRGAEWSKE